MIRSLFKDRSSLDRWCCFSIPDSRLFPGKLKSKWSGPFIIKEVKPYGAVELEDPATKASWTVNGQRLKPYFGGEVNRLTSTISLDNP